MASQAKSIFEGSASLFTLTNSQWTAKSKGTVKLIYNPNNPSELLLKGNCDGEDEVIYQIKPKLKAKNNSSWVLKGTNTKNKEEEIIAIRFADEDESKEFFKLVSKAAEYEEKPDDDNDNDNEEKIHRTPTMSPHDLYESLPPQKWECVLCTFTNDAKNKSCGICMTPRPLVAKNISDIHLAADALPLSPRLGNNGSNGNDKEKNANLAPSWNNSGIYGNAPPSPTNSEGGFDWGSASTNTLPEKPQKKDDISSKTEDFVRVLTLIESNLTDPKKGQKFEDYGEKLFDDLRKVAKRLLRNDDKYRVLDLNNKIVQQRLLKVPGVDAYLQLLGFESNKEETKLTCPNDQPAKSIIKIAQDTCKDFMNRAKEKKEGLEHLRRFSHIKHEQSDETPDEKNNDNNNNNNNNKNKNKDNNKNNNDEKVELSDEDDEYTLKQIVWTVTHENERNDKMTQVLLLCHRTFSTSLDLMKLLIERFDKNASEPDDPELTKAQKNTRIKVVNMLKHWIQNFYIQDFEEQTEVLDLICEFIEWMKDNENNQISLFYRNLHTQLTLKEQELEQNNKEKNKNQKILQMIGNEEKNKFDKQDAEAIAEQITLMDFNIFKEIKKRECLGQAWKKKDRDVKAPNILRMIDQFNRVSKWVQVLILTAPSLKDRIKIVKKCIKIAEHLHLLRNFSSLCAFNSALLSIPIHRLKTVWENIPEKYTKIFNEIQQIFDVSGNFGLLRKLHRTAHAPAILHTGIFLQDIVAIDESTDDRQKNGRVNFAKLINVYERIETLCMYQQSGYDIQENKMIQKVIIDDFKAQEKLDEDRLFQFSTDVKKKDGGAKV